MSFIPTYITCRGCKIPYLNVKIQGGEIIGLPQRDWGALADRGYTTDFPRLSENSRFSLDEESIYSGRNHIFSPHFYLHPVMIIFIISLNEPVMKSKYPHGYLPKIQYHSLEVVRRTRNLMEPNLSSEFVEGEMEGLIKSLDSITYFSQKIRESLSPNAHDNRI